MFYSEHIIDVYDCAEGAYPLVLFQPIQKRGNGSSRSPKTARENPNIGRVKATGGWSQGEKILSKMGSLALQLLRVAEI